MPNKKPPFVEFELETDIGGISVLLARRCTGPNTGYTVLEIDVPQEDAHSIHFYDKDIIALRDWLTAQLITID